MGSSISTTSRSIWAERGKEDGSPGLIQTQLDHDVVILEKYGSLMDRRIGSFTHLFTLPKIALWIVRVAAVAAVIAGLWGLLNPSFEGWQPASTGSEIREWLLVLLGALYFFFDYRLKQKAEERAARDEARKVHDRKRAGQDRD